MFYQKEELFVDLVLAGLKTNIKHLIFHLKIEEKGQLVEFKGSFYNIPASKIGPKPVQKPHLPVYMGGFSTNTYSRIVNPEANSFLSLLDKRCNRMIKIIK